MPHGHINFQGMVGISQLCLNQQFPWCNMLCGLALSACSFLRNIKCMVYIVHVKGD